MTSQTNAPFAVASLFRGKSGDAFQVIHGATADVEREVTRRTAEQQASGKGKAIECCATGYADATRASEMAHGLADGPRKATVVHALAA